MKQIRIRDGKKSDQGSGINIPDPGPDPVKSSRSGLSHLKGIDVLLLGENILEAVPYLGWVEVGGPAQGGAVLVAVHVGGAEALLHVNS